MNIQVSYVILTYNHERYIRDAIHGALEQTYSPLELVISDDCSTDGTYEIILQTVQSYRGPHRIIINRNSTNLGIVAHHNKVLSELVTGDYIVEAGGDDISVPERTATLVAAYRATGASLITSDYDVIDSNDNIIRNRRTYSRCVHTCFRYDWMAERGMYNIGMLGATLSFEKRIFTDFGQLPLNVHTEDFSLISRASLVKGCSVVNQPLIKYRIHPGNQTLMLQTQNAKNLSDFIKLHHNFLLFKMNNHVNYIELVKIYRKKHCEEKSPLDQSEMNLRSELTRTEFEKTVLNRYFLSRLRCLLRNITTFKCDRQTLKVVTAAIWGKPYYYLMWKIRISRRLV